MTRRRHDALLRGRAPATPLLARSMKEQYEAMLKYFGENLNSTPSDTEFWIAIAAFVDKFSATQKALLAVRTRSQTQGGMPPTRSA